MDVLYPCVGCQQPGVERTIAIGGQESRFYVCALCWEARVGDYFKLKTEYEQMLADGVHPAFVNARMMVRVDETLTKEAQRE